MNVQCNWPSWVTHINLIALTKTILKINKTQFSLLERERERERESLGNDNKKKYK